MLTSKTAAPIVIIIICVVDVLFSPFSFGMTAETVGSGVFIGVGLGVGLKVGVGVGSGVGVIVSLVLLI